LKRSEVKKNLWIHAKIWSEKKDFYPSRKCFVWIECNWLSDYDIQFLLFSCN
jgi:hypothetical protein